MPTATLRDTLKLRWGYDTFRPLQEQAIRCVLEQRDSIVVLPTGGGKSLCYQLPATEAQGLALVVSPLISLMKDQVDALNAMGIPAACISSMMTQDEKYTVWRELQQGLIQVLYCAPERLARPIFLEFLQSIEVAYLVVDEAHCISEWGHDFRADYLKLAAVREALPNLAVHAFTATATPRVREDIAQQLQMRDPEVIIGPFERLNLHYSVRPRTAKPLDIVLKILKDHPNESGVIYCISRKEVDELTHGLNARGIAALPYHAGMTANDRTANQEAFSQERADLIVATVAFGMGVDKSNVRFVIHTGMPKTLENYQQESGRAGRDGLEAKCYLLYSPADIQKWRFLAKNNDAGLNRVAEEKLRQVEQYCSMPQCRHRTLVGYFGQDLGRDNCGACDVCLGEVDTRDDATALSRTIIACVLGLDERFGGAYTTAVLTASGADPRVAQNGHDRLPEYGALREHEPRAVRDWIEQLVAQGCLAKTGDYGVLAVTGEGRLLLGGNGRATRLSQYHEKVSPRKSKAAAGKSWVGVDRALFEKLRARRRDLSTEHSVPAYVILSDASLRDLARLKPSDHTGLLACHGVGTVKAERYGAEFLAVIEAYSGGAGEETPQPARGPSAAANPERVHDLRERAYALLREEVGVEELAARLNINGRKAADFVASFLRFEERESPAPWVDLSTFEDVEAIVRTTLERKPRRLAEAYGSGLSPAQAEWCVICLDNRV